MKAKSSELHAGLCIGDDVESVVSVATHWMMEGDEAIAYEDHEIASNIAHELTHAKQFCKRSDQHDRPRLETQ